MSFRKESNPNKDRLVCFFFVLFKVLLIAPATATGIELRDWTWSLDLFKGVFFFALIIFASLFSIFYCNYLSESKSPFYLKALVLCDPLMTFAVLNGARMIIAIAFVVLLLLCVARHRLALVLLPVFSFGVSIIDFKSFFGFAAIILFAIFLFYFDNVKGRVEVLLSCVISLVAVAIGVGVCSSVYKVSNLSALIDENLLSVYPYSYHATIGVAFSVLPFLLILILIRYLKPNMSSKQNKQNGSRKQADVSVAKSLNASFTICTTVYLALLFWGIICKDFGALAAINLIPMLFIGQSSVLEDRRLKRITAVIEEKIDKHFPLFSLLMFLYFCISFYLLKYPPLAEESLIAFINDLTL